MRNGRKDKTTKRRATEWNRKIQFKIVSTRLYEWIILFQHLPGSRKFAYCMYHSSAKLTFSFSVLKWFIQRCSKNILNLVAMQYAHPFTPKWCACSLHSKRRTENRRKNDWALVELVSIVFQHKYLNDILEIFFHIEYFVRIE